MPMTTRVANKTKRPALVVIQARSPKKTRRKLTSRKQKEAPPETGIEHISEIETRQAEIHTDTSNATPAATTRATRPRRETATVGAVVTQKKGSRHALKSQNGPKNGGISSAEADFKEDADSNSEELEEPPAVPTSWENTQRESAPRETYKEVRTAIEARKLQHVANQAQTLVVNKNQDQELASGDQEPVGNRPSTKRAHVYDLADSNTPAIRSPVAKRTRGSRFEGSSKTSTRQAVPKINWNEQVKLTKRANATAKSSAVRPPIEAGMDDILDLQQVDTSVELLQADGEDSQFRAYEHGGRFEGTDDATDDRHDIRAKQRVKSSDQLTWMGGRDTATDAAVESNDGKTYLSSEISSSEYEPSELGKSESAFDEMDSDTGRNSRNSPDDDKSVPIPPDRYHMRSPFLNELYDDYKEWHRRSDDEDDQSSIHIW
ncbi:hypothetical protein Agabi119p4_9940 [Agaricus bisporus var. burnettii]|uniref:Uncharacterized protein n=1 Tax=Agaricus bisporus var. burnettii TaxID=192524 RepID=A0A8H7EX48_AGABI|nr:hypothetical protein Agabi119p4_9940 [Agaricus bisporus var. burnettii]